MHEKSVQELLQAWQETDTSIDKFLEEKYLEFHKGEPGTLEEKQTVIRHRIVSWRRNIQKMETDAALYLEKPDLREWQASEMLDNVMQELGMTSAEEYRYLLNVRLLCSFRLYSHLDPVEAAEARTALEAEYDTEWERAECASELKRSELYGKTVRMMQHVGITYEDDTRRILADIGAGRQAQFPEASGEDREVLCLLTSFLASEMVLSEEGAKEKLSSKEQTLLAEQAVPLYAAAAALTPEGRDPGTLEKLAQTTLGASVPGRCLSLLLVGAAAYTAVQAVFLAVELAAAGAVVTLSLKALRGIWTAVSTERRPALSAQMPLPRQRQDEEAGEEQDALEDSAETEENRILAYE